jgi:NADP-dependent 3-hydroxy acid dehydrogenase YdfG
MQLTGKRTVLITGCTDGGIGSALAQEFNKHGYKVFASARRMEAMSALPAEVTRVVVGAAVLLPQTTCSGLACMPSS